MNKQDLVKGKKYNTEHGIMIFDEAEYSSDWIKGHTENGNQGLWLEEEIISERKEDKATPYNKKEILQAVLDDKTILFRVDDGEQWSEVKDNDWVLKMLGENSEYCFKIKPDLIVKYIRQNFREYETWYETDDQDPFYQSIKIVVDPDTNKILNVKLMEAEE